MKKVKVALAVGFCCALLSAGSFDATGPVLSGEYMIVNSGYATFGQIPGNVVLVFKLRENR